MTFTIDGVSYEARTEPDLRFLRPYGTVFQVFDRLLSGNLCFGVEGPYGRLFIKFAGAETVNFTGRPRDAAELLKNAMPLWETRHPALPRLLSHGPLVNGYAAVYEWLDAAQLTNSDPSDTHVRQRLLHLPVTSRLSLIDPVFSLHEALAEKGYVAADFSSRNILIDFETARLWVCDIDSYVPCPFLNALGRMPGEIGYLAPEELTRGSTVSEDSTVYKLGRLALCFFSDDETLSEDRFSAPSSLFPVIKRALEEDRSLRYRTVHEFLTAWRAALGNTWIR